jgi:hypothetical protein
MNLHLDLLQDIILLNDDAFEVDDDGCVTIEGHGPPGGERELGTSNYRASQPKPVRELWSCLQVASHIREAFTATPPPSTVCHNRS